MAANPRAVMRALKATAPAPSMGGYGSVPAPYIGPGPSPLVASYNEWQGGHAYGQHGGLPRDWQTFLSGAFGPLAPIQPVPIDIPEPGKDRPAPRRMVYPVGADMPMGVPGTEGWGKLADFKTLRTLADLYSVARNCIELRKSELRGIGWDISPTSQAAKAMRGDHRAAADFAERRAQAVRFFRCPDPDYSDFTSWFNTLLEEFFVTDAAALFPHPSRMRSKGLLGSDVAALEIIDGTQAKPLVDIRGGKPKPPNPAYQIFGHGVPRVDLMTLILEGDGTDRDGNHPEGLLAEYRGDQLMYLPYTRRSWTPYGAAPIERALIPIMSGLAKQNFQLQYFQEGSIPGVYISPGDASMSPSQLRELQDALNAIAGDQAWKHKIIVVPGGSKIDPQKPVPLADDFDTLVQIQTCMAFDVQPFELGIIPQMSAAAASSGSARQMIGAHVDIRSRKSTVPILLFFKSAIFDRILQDVCGQLDMEWSWQGLEEQGNEDVLTELLTSQVSVGLASIDEARQQLGRDPWGLPITSDPGWATQWGGFVPLTGVTEATAQPLGGSPGPGGPGRGTRGGAAVDLTSPGGVPRAGAPSAPVTVPRNRMSSGQRREQARQVSTTQNRTGATGTPAHSGARQGERTTPMRTAAGLPPVGGRAAKANGAIREAVTGTVLFSTDGLADTAPPGLGDAAKAVRELGLLRSHLRRGGRVSAWQPRHIPPYALHAVTVALADGASPAEACEAAKAALETAAKNTPGLTSGSGRISLDLPEGTIPVLPGGVLDHHITVVYLGPDVDDEAFADACARAGAAAQMVPGPLTGRIGGVGSFPASVSSDGKVPVFAPMHLPGGEILRAALENLSASEHTGWHPHVTLRYQDEGELLPAPVQPVPVTFTHLSVHRGGDVRRFPLGGELGKAARAKPWKALDPNLSPREAVHRQMSKDFPPDAIGWVLDKSTRWEGPGRVPIDRISTSHVESWAAAHERAKVDRFKRRIRHRRRDGKPVKPAVLVQTPRNKKLIVVDGHHRVLAARELGQPIEAWVGHVRAETGPWDETHSAQLHHGGGRAGKASGPVAAGIAVRAADTGRVLMLQRAVTGDDDPAAGYWEFPGGTLDAGEAAVEAARREWSEEAGIQVPDGEITGHWQSGNGVYEGFVLTVPSEDDVELGARDDVINPDDPDGDAIEALAWWLPDDLANNRGIRPELANDLDAVLAALGASIGKSERTPYVSTVHNPVGHESLWHTPDKHVGHMQQLPAYMQNTALALQREHGYGEQQAIATAVNAVDEWRHGRAFGGKVKVTPEVQAAAQAAWEEWTRLKASHH